MVRHGRSRLLSVHVEHDRATNTQPHDCGGAALNDNDANAAAIIIRTLAPLSHTVGPDFISRACVCDSDRFAPNSVPLFSLKGRSAAGCCTKFELNRRFIGAAARSSLIREPVNF